MRMSKPNGTPDLLGEALLQTIRQAVREEIQDAIGQNGHQDDDRLHDAEEASKILSVSEDWIYRHASRLPFTRRLGPKMLRFSSQDIQKWMATRKIPNTTSTY